MVKACHEKVVVLCVLDKEIFLFVFVVNILQTSMQSLGLKNLLFVSFELPVERSSFCGDNPLDYTPDTSR